MSVRVSRFPAASRSLVSAKATATAIVALVATCAAGCVGSTGSDLVEFRAYAAGPTDATGSSYSFVTSLGFEVTLTRARLVLGGLYLNRSMPISGGQARSCILPGTYVGEVPGGTTIDVLDGRLQPFATPGHGTADRAVTGEVWLTAGDVDALDDKGIPILDVEGTASRGSVVVPFEGRVTIGRNRLVPPTDPARPGANPICKQRIVSPIPIDLVPVDGGALVVRIDPRGFFTNVAFDDLELVSDAPKLYRFKDDATTSSGNELFRGLRASEGVYSFSFERNAP
ncbi:MAG: hypothetical protein U0169_02665 [Polyangiaceae bacterium]